MIRRNSGNLASYVTEQLSNGKLVFTPGDAEKALGISRGAFLDAAEKLQKRQLLLSPRRGFYVIVPPQYLNWGSPPPASFIDALMRHEKRPYYVGLLKAAEFHGASHHAVMEFQVITDKRLPNIRAGRTNIVFYFRKDMGAVSAGLEERKTDTGYMKISSAELTVLDLIRYPQANGGLDNVLTVLGELGSLLDSQKLIKLCRAYEAPVVQRVGYLLSLAGFRSGARDLCKYISARGALRWVELEPLLAKNSKLSPSVIERDKNWRVIVRRLPERDE